MARFGKNALRLAAMLGGLIGTSCCSDRKAESPATTVQGIQDVFARYITAIGINDLESFDSAAHPDSDDASNTRNVEMSRADGPRTSDRELLSFKYLACEEDLAFGRTRYRKRLHSDSAGDTLFIDSIVAFRRSAGAWKFWMEGPIEVTRSEAALDALDKNLSSASPVDEGISGALQEVMQRWLDAAARRDANQLAAVSDLESHSVQLWVRDAKKDTSGRSGERRGIQSFKVVAIDGAFAFCRVVQSKQSDAVAERSADWLDELVLFRDNGRGWRIWSAYGL